MPLPFVRQSISRKLVLAVLVTTLTALLFASAALLILDIRKFQTGWVNDLRAQGDILAQVTRPALEFSDAASATENLAQLTIRPRIFAAAIYLPDGKLFARYDRQGAAARALPAMPAEAGQLLDSEIVQVFVAINRGDERLGMLYLGTEYPLLEQVRYYAGVLALVMLLSAAIAWFLSSRLQRVLTRPIRQMTDAVNDVIRRRDFSARVQKLSQDEVGTLVDAFNAMLVEVGERSAQLEASESALRELNNTLEERIQERTQELQRAHAQLRQSQKLEAVGQLTGGVAHDFNNVLQVISGNLQLLQMSLATNPDARKRLESAIFAADRGAKLSAQLLAFARRQPLQPLSTNVGRILRGMDDLLRRALGESVHIETVVSGGLWTTLVDPHQLENVILNLAINARDAMKGEGRLTLELGNAMLTDDYVAAIPELQPGQYVVLAISDTGSGMPPEVAARAFEPFFTTKPEGQGTGLGLSMAYGFVKQSNGHIQIYSEAGNGTTIKIYLPRSMQAEVEAENPRHLPMVGGSETILVVEDDLAVQGTVVDMLTGLGYRVLRADDGNNALTILRSGVPVDLIFTDVVMPGPVRSIEMTRQAKQMFPDIRVLYTSGYTQNAIVHGGRLDPGVELISKPYRREELARKIRSMLGNRPAEPAPGALSIMVVEDNNDARAILVELLTMLGHKVQQSPTAEAALPLLTADPVDVLLTDYTLPGMTGVALAREVTAVHPRMRVIFSSGHGPTVAADAGIPFQYLPKPFTVEKLQEILSGEPAGVR
jgi:signal transduction histidine kinase/CheY-like chemotaxis protein